MDIDTLYPIHRCLCQVEFDLYALFPIQPHCGEPHLPYDPVAPNATHKKRTIPNPLVRSSKPKKMKAHHQEQQQQQQQQQQQKSQSTSSPPVPQEMATVNGIEDDLHHLQDEWASIEIVLKSLQNAYSVRPLENAPEQLLDDVDRELSIAYDELKAQVRHLARSLQRLDKKIEPFRPLKPSLAQSPDQHYQPHSGGTYCPSMLARPRD